MYAHEHIRGQCSLDILDAEESHDARAVCEVQTHIFATAFDVDDIFLNAIGGLTGFLCYTFVWKKVTKQN